jgi:hypothetical protein
MISGIIGLIMVTNKTEKYPVVVKACLRTKVKNFQYFGRKGAY